MRKFVSWRANTDPAYSVRVFSIVQQYDTPSDVWCPHPPCPPPVPDCQHVLPTFFFYEGRLCRGCDYCDDGQRKRMISENFPYCPDVQCETWAPPCPVQVQYQRIPVADYICTGCPFCPVDTTAASAKLLSG
ncbi:hypothetical protein BaRGS_00014029 [Batillaria attramentaria]|uniref:TNFR-Cys domain-containing protein n=1 Tax=Batillaria attramentaria TaxID=370345 RepID=A0ABD0L5U3_9CAEN